MSSSQGRPLTPEVKKLIVSVKHYFDRNDFKMVKPSTKHAANATGVGVATVKRIMADYNRDPNLLDRPSRSKGRPPHAISDSIQTIVRSYIRKANQDGKHITLEMLREHLESSAPEQSICISTLGRTLDRWGFKFDKGTGWMNKI